MKDNHKIELEKVKEKYLNNKATIEGLINTAKDKDSEEEAREIMFAVLSIIDSRTSKEDTLEGIDMFFNYIDNIKPKTYQNSYIEEVEDTLMMFIQNVKEDKLNQLLNNYTKEYERNISYLNDVIAELGDIEENNLTNEEIIEAFATYLFNTDDTITETKAEEDIKFSIETIDLQAMNYKDNIDLVSNLLRKWLNMDKELYENLVSEYENENS